MAEKLTIKERLFCKFYLVNGYNAKQAAVSAGFSETYADKVGWKLLRKSRVSAFIHRRIKAIEDKLDITAEEKMTLLWKTAKRCYGPTDDEVEQIKKGEKVEVAFTFQPNALATNISELNKMQGHYKKIDADGATEKLNEMSDKLNELVEQNKKEY